MTGVSGGRPGEETVAKEGSARAVRGASLLVLLQVASRALTFVANQLLLRFLTAETLGVSTQLEVYYLSVLFFARESLRVAIQRQGGSSSSSQNDRKKDDASSSSYTLKTRNDSQAVVNLGYLSIALGALVAVVLGWLYLGSISTSAALAATPNLVPSLYLYGLASVVELLSEPVFVVMQVRLRFGTRAKAESMATFLRCLVTLGSAVWASRRSRPLGVLPFALGQLAYGLGLLAVYASDGRLLARAEGFGLLPRRVAAASPAATSFVDGGYFYQPTLRLASSLMAQSVVKHVLTQGDTFLVSVLASPAAQGVYALSNNYGGLAARLVLQPVEESCRNYFGRLLAAADTSGETGDAIAKNPDLRTAPHQHKHHMALDSLLALLALYAHLALLVVVLAPRAAAPILTIVAGPAWIRQGAASCLSLYVLVLPLLALNGVLEAFVTSVATEHQVHMQSLWMAGFSVCFVGAAFLCLRLLDMGAEGLVVANAVNMACRICWSCIFISRYFSTRGMRVGMAMRMKGWMPGKMVVGAAVVADAVLRRLLGYVDAHVDAHVAGSVSVFSAREAVVQLVKIAGVGLPFLGIIIFSQRNFVLQSYRS